MSFAKSPAKKRLRTSNPSNEQSNTSNVKVNNNIDHNNADAYGVLNLKQTTDNYYRFLSSFIAHHLPPLPTISSIIDQLEYKPEQFNKPNQLFTYPSLDEQMNKARHPNHLQNNDNSNSNSNSKTNLNGEDEANKSQLITNATQTKKQQELRQQLFAAQQTITNLKHSMDKLQDTNRDLIENNNIQSTVIQNQKVEIAELKNMLLAIRDIAIGRNTKPRYGSITYCFKKPNDEEHCSYKRTSNLDNLRKFIRSNFDNSQWVMNAASDNKHVFDDILDFITENDEYNMKPLILIPVRLKSQNQQLIQNEKIIFNTRNQTYYRKYQQSEIMQEFLISNHTRIPSLNGQLGLRTLIDIPPNTVLGQYCGVEYLDDEFYKVYVNTKEFDDKNIYAFTLPVFIDKNMEDPFIKKFLLRKQNESPERSGKRKKNRKKINSDSPQTKVDIVVDALELKLPLIRINDCRKDITCKTCSQDDLKTQNIEFVRVALNGWPCLFVITTKLIPKGGEIFGFYGDNYYNAVREKKLQSEFRYSTQKMIDEHILKGKLNQIDQPMDLTN